jgi:hypothetical protein
MRHPGAGAYAGRSLAFQAVERSSAPVRPDTECALRLEGRQVIASRPPLETVDADGFTGRVSLRQWRDMRNELAVRSRR